MAGVFYGGDGHQLGVQILGVITIGLWSSIICFALFQILKLLGILRVPQDEEITGLDISHHAGGPRVAVDGQKAMAAFQPISTPGTPLN